MLREIVGDFELCLKGLFTVIVRYFEWSLMEILKGILNGVERVS